MDTSKTNANLLPIRCAVLGLFALSACSSTVDEPEGTESVLRSTTSAVAPAALRGASVKARTRAPAEVQQKTAAILGIFAGAPVDAADVAVVNVDAKHAVLGATRRVPNVRTEYDSTSDTFDATDVELARVRGGVEVSETEARGRFQAVLQSLIAKSVVGASDFSAGNAEVGRVIQGAGSSAGGPPIESVKEYRFFVPRKVNGIIVRDAANRDLGLRVSIHRSGALRGVRIAGAGLEVTAGASLTQAVDQLDLEDKVTADHPNSEITALGLRYILGAPDAEPRQVYKVSRRSVVDGAIVHSRAVTVHYSVTDGSKPPTLWPKPNPGDSSRTPRVP